MEFVNRKIELKGLGDRYADNRAELFVLYGRRRTGKTAMLREFCRGKGNVYFLAAQLRELDNLRQLKHDLLGESVISIPARGGRARRDATLTVRSAVVTLHPPFRKGEKLEEVTVHAVLLREEAPAKGIEPLEWLLLTDLPVNSWEDVQFVINGYLCRWQIECFFKVLKSGCKVEKLQLETPERFLPCLGLYLIISWRVLYLTMLGRSCPSDLPCSLFFDDAEWKSMVMVVTKKLPEKPPTLTEMIRMIAQQGSFVGRNGDGHPGIVSIWVGLQRGMDYARGWMAFGPEKHLYET